MIRSTPHCKSCGWTYWASDPSANGSRENLAAYGSILDEIRKLRTLDLADIHPVVVFDPSLPYRRP